ncbi:helix-turn-helix domain-containing protein [Limnobacter sp. P1]|uniref:helix-turn-helix domain-containing protein n=1 Tax=Limnobacter olei TaxID=3031298 RepID=UPI0023AF0E7A|nr:AraC family transcriptional regulator [Limnobacter sp. P1]
MNQHSNLGHISASYVNLLFDWLAETHPDVAQTNPFARPVAGELNRIEVPQWQAMLQWTYQTLQDPAMPLKIAAHVRPANMGLLGYVASCCTNLGEAFARLQQFENLVYSVNALNVAFQGDEIILRWGAERGRPGHWVDSVAIGVLVAFTQHLIAIPVYPRRVQFINPMPENPSDFDTFFQCKVGFAGDYTEVVWPVSLLEMPLKSPDHVMRSMLDQQAQLLLKQVKNGEESIPGFQKALQESVGAGLPSLSEVARRLCVSTRTLQRRLQEQGSSFRDELEQVRVEMAKNCLQAGDLSLADIASFLAYNDQSAFTHAFKRVTGVSPAKYQRTKRQ